MDRTQLMDYLIEEAEYNPSEVRDMSRFELIDKWLEYEGVIGYTEEIMETIEEVYHVKLKE